MTKFNAEILLEQEPYKMIKWFTLNYDKEIGAVGVGKIENQRVIVEKLYFPEQEVTGATVHFTSDDWKPIIRELVEKHGETEAIEQLKKIVFYWHKHPSGSAKPSATDEEKTFDAFMDDDVKRRYFAFLQTAKKTYGAGDLEWEPRIEMRYPIRHTIENVRVITRDTLDVASKCKKIIETKIKKPVVVPNTLYVANNQPKIVTKTNITTHANKCSEIAEEEGADFMLQNGHIVLEVLDDYALLVDQALEHGTLNAVVSQFKPIQMKDTCRYFLQPVKGSIQKLKEVVASVHARITDLHIQRAKEATKGTISQLTPEEIAEIMVEEQETLVYDNELNAYDSANKQILSDYDKKQQALQQDVQNLAKMGGY